MKLLSFILFAIICVCSCSSSGNNSTETEPNNSEEISFFYGADLSYVNEMEDCGAIYKNQEGQVQDPYQIFSDEGANIIRLRLWHNPQWTNYSNFEDVKKSISRAKSLGLKVLLDFHYSDTWADPSKQQIPAAWIDEVNNPVALGNLLYDYTYNTLKNLHDLNLLPDIVQIGNEINPMILQDGPLQWPIDWDRNSLLLNQGIKAVRDLNLNEETTIEVMLHIAQPENALWWFDQASNNGVLDFDWIGLSYYPIWSDYTLDNVGQAFSQLINLYNKKLMIVETAYPYTLEDVDNANNILGEDALINGFPASEQGQLDYLLELANTIKDSGGLGLIYWEPAWVSTNCNTLWAQGSHWDNATMFNDSYQAHKGITFFNLSQAE